MLRDSLRYTHHQPNLRFDRFFNTCRGHWWRDEDGRGIGASLLHGIRDRSENRLAEVLAASFLGVGSTDDVGAVFDCLCCVEGALSPGLVLLVWKGRRAGECTYEALENDFRLVIDP